MYVLHNNNPYCSAFTNILKTILQQLSANYQQQDKNF